MELQLSVQDLRGVRLALENQIDRVELLAALELEGLTPSLGMIELAAGIGVPISVMIRPRPGDFAYGSDNLKVMLADINAALEAGATGINVGVLNQDGHFDLEAMQPFAEAVHSRMGAEMSFHRATDVAIRQGEPIESILEKASQLGVVRITTSGGTLKARDGLETLGKMQEMWGENGLIQAAGGVMFEDLPDIARHGLSAAHLSARAKVVSQNFVDANGKPVTYTATDPDMVASVSNYAKS